MDPTEAYEVLCYVPAQSLPYNQPGTCYTLVALPKEDPTAGETLSRYQPGSRYREIFFLSIEELKVWSGSEREDTSIFTEFLL